MNYIEESKKKIPIVYEADVVVVGGGPAGVGAAFRASQNGAKTVIIEKLGSFGGINTNGLMSIVIGGKHLAAQIFKKLELDGYIVNLLEKFPSILSNPLIHYAQSITKENAPDKLWAFNPYMCSCVINEILEESGVKFILNSLFVDVIIKNGFIDSVIIENCSGRQAIKGKVYIDTTGRGDLIAKAGVPFNSAQNELGKPMPMGLMWTMSGVNYNRLLEYQKYDPCLDSLIKEAKNELPYYKSKKSKNDMVKYDAVYTGHPCPEICPSLYPGDVLMWEPVDYDLGLNGAENVDDLNYAETSIRKQIQYEIKFLKNHVPGFENSYLSAIAPFMGIREGRHPIGEYILSYDDILNSREFEDVVIKDRTYDHLDLRKLEKPFVYYQVPYRSLLPKGIDNLLIAGDVISADHGAYLHMRGFGRAMNLGEVAGISAALSIKETTNPKDLKYKILRRGLLKNKILP